MAYTSLQRTLENLEVSGLGAVKDKLLSEEREFYIRVSNTNDIGTIRHMIYSLLFHMNITKQYRIKVNGTEIMVQRKTIAEISSEAATQFKSAQRIKGSVEMQAAKTPTEAEADAEAADFMSMLED